MNKQQMAEMRNEGKSKLGGYAKWLGIAFLAFLAVMVVTGMRDAASNADVQTAQAGAGISQYTEELMVDWIMLPGEEPIIIRHDDGSTWTVLPFGPSGSVE